MQWYCVVMIQQAGNGIEEDLDKGSGKNGTGTLDR